MQPAQSGHACRSELFQTHRIMSTSHLCPTEARHISKDRSRKKKQARATTNATSTLTSAPLSTTPTKPTAAPAVDNVEDEVLVGYPGIDIDTVLRNEDYASTMDIMAILGANHIGTYRFASPVVKPPPAAFMEVYGQGGMAIASHGERRALSCKGLSALDLRTWKPDGTPWEFANAADRAMATQMIEEQKPAWITGSPPCTAFCAWIAHLNCNTIAPEKGSEHDGGKTATSSIYDIPRSYPATSRPAYPSRTSRDSYKLA